MFGAQNMKEGRTYKAPIPLYSISMCVVSEGKLCTILPHLLPRNCSGGHDAGCIQLNQSSATPGTHPATLPCSQKSRQNTNSCVRLACEGLDWLMCIKESESSKAVCNDELCLFSELLGYAVGFFHLI